MLSSTEAAAGVQQRAVAGSEADQLHPLMKDVLL